MNRLLEDLEILYDSTVDDYGTSIEDVDNANNRIKDFLTKYVPIIEKLKDVDVEELTKEFEYLEEFKSQSMYTYYGDIYKFEFLLDLLKEVE